MSLKSKLLYNFNLIHLHYWQKNRKKLLPFYQKEGKSSSLPNTIVYMCDGRMGVGGLCDRLHGIISLYIFCKERGLNFKVNFCEPFELQEYLEPNEYDWCIKSNKLTYNLIAAKPIIVLCSYRSNGGTLEDELASQLRYLDKVVKKNVGREVHVYTNMHYAHTANVFSKYFQELFKPSKSLIEAVKIQKERVGKLYISVTLRFQNLLGDFQEGKFPTLDCESQNILIKKVKDKIIELHNTRHPDINILVTSDSRRFLNVVEDIDYIFTIPGKIVHMTYTPVHDFATHLKSFVDLMMLADAQKLYLLVTGQMYRSGFAESASFINCRPYEVIEW